MRRSAALPAVVLVTIVVFPSAALPQEVSGWVFDDRDGDGVQDSGEPPLEGLSIGIFGRTSSSTPVDVADLTAPDGSWSFTPGDGCYIIDFEEPQGWRLAPPRHDRFPSSTPGYLHPIGVPRFGVLAQGVGRLRAGGSYRYAAMGDSIAWNFNVCGYPESFWYSRRVSERLDCAAPAASVLLDAAAVKGEHTDDLLVDDTNDNNNVFRIIETQPALVTLSMIGNDLLDVDVTGTPTQAQVNTAVEEILDSRRNLQEALSSMVSWVPGADIAVNTLYDNLAYNCPSTPTSPFHRAWVPIIGRILRDVAWGQARRAGVVEVAADFRMQSLDGSCTGFSSQICRDIFGFDRIHPNNNGYTLIREKLWEAVGGATLGAGDARQRSSITGIGLGLLRRVRRIEPTVWSLSGGASAIAPEAALDLDDGGAVASITLGAGAEELRLEGFPDHYDEIEIVKVVASVRYRTTGAVADDGYRMEASVTGQFEPPPGHDFSPTSWSFATPIVGGGGPNQPAANPDYPTASLLVRPNVASYREVSATVMKDPVVSPGGDDYEWPPVTRQELSTAAIRVVSVPLAGMPGNDGYTIELDGAWLDLYGWEKPRPPEVTNVEARLGGTGEITITFDEVAGAQRYNVYAGSLPIDGLYDHGAGAPAGPHCDATTIDAGLGRRSVDLAPAAQPPGSAFILVTAHVDDVESPAGFDSTGAEIDRSASICN